MIMNEIIKNTDYRKWISELKQQSPEKVAQLVRQILITEIEQFTGLAQSFPNLSAIFWRGLRVKSAMMPAVTVAVSKARHPALDAGSSEKLTSSFRILLVKSGQARNDETASSAVIADLPPQSFEAINTKIRK
jgi:hypothetical protein